MKKIMNWVLAATLICGASVFTACTDIEDNPVTPEPAAKTSIDILLEDYEALVAEYPEAKDRFVEARYVLETPISETGADNVKAVGVEVICYTWDDEIGKSKIFVLNHDFTTEEKELNLVVANSPFLGDELIEDAAMKELKVSLEDAMNLAKDKGAEMGGTDGLNSRYVTLRKPVYPFFDHLQYVVGGSPARIDHFFVDAVTGEVQVNHDIIEED